MQELDEIHRLLSQQRPTEWEAMPDIALYMDQVISYLPRQTIGASEDTMTPAMINNYIKDGLLPRANGKRYSREHLVYLTAIALLKNVLSVKNIKLLLDAQIQENAVQEFYTKFLAKVDASFEDVACVIDSSLGEDQLAEFAMDLAVAACAAKIACEQLLSVLRLQGGAEQEGKEKTKEKSRERTKERK